MKIIGIDPGYDRCGMAVVERIGREKETVLDSMCITTTSTDSFEERLFQVVQEFRNWLEKHKPDVCAFEKLYFTKNQKTAMRVAETRGALIVAAHESGARICEFGPGEIKVAITGSGRASKTQVTAMILRISNMDKQGALDDEYDAVAVALTALASLRV
jgi:crossover junction endodeoxyribonuclease RuvC